MKRIIILSLCFLCSPTCSIYSQDPRVIDSLNHLLKNKAGADRIGPMFQLAFEYINKDNVAALRILEELDQMSTLCGDSLWIVRIKRVKGQILYLLERTVQSEEVLMYALKVALRRNLLTERLYIEHTLGKIKLFNGKYDDALKTYFNVLELAEETGDEDDKAIAFNSIGIVYYKLKDYENGLIYFKKALEAHRSVGKIPSFIPANIGLCYAHAGDLMSARRFVQMAELVCGYDCPDRSKIGIEYTLGIISLKETDYPEAKKHFTRSYELSKAHKDTRFLLDNIYMLSDLHIRNRQYHLAEIYLMEGERTITPETPFNLELIKLYYQLSELFIAMHDYKRATHYQRKYIGLKDSIYDERLTIRLMKTEAELQERENTAKIAARDEIIALNREVIYRKDIINSIVVLLAIISLAFVIFLWYFYKQKRNLNFLLERRIAERTQELQSSRDELIKAFREHDLLSQRTSYGVNEALKSIKGLCVTGMKEISDPLALTYMKQIDSTSRRLDKLLK